MLGPCDEETQARYRDELFQGLKDVALKFGEGVSSSGSLYKWMVDCRELLLVGPYLHYACRLLWERLKKYEPEVVGGLTLAANPMTIGIMYESRLDGQPVEGVLIRRQPKYNGLQKQVEGGPIAPGSRLALLDDLVNSGDTQRKALAAVRPFDCVVPVVGVVVNYERSGVTWLQERGIAVEALFTLTELGISPTKGSDSELLRHRWEVELNRGEYGAPKSSPVAYRNSLLVGSDKGFLLCLDLQGEERWRREVRDRERGIHSTPALHNGKVYFGSYDGFLTCLDAESGSLVWECRPGQWIGSSPVVSAKDELVFVGVEYGERGGSLMAFEAETGRQRWEMAAENYVHSTPFYDGARNQVLVGANDGKLRAVEVETGKVSWTFETEGAIKAQAVVDEQGRCFFGSFDGFLYALEAGTGQLLWKKKLSQRL